MKVAKLISHTSGQPVVIGTIKLINGQLAADTLAAQRVLGRTLQWNGRDYTSADGEAFLDVLPDAFSGSYVGFEIEDEPEVPQRHAREPEGMFAVPQSKPRPIRKGYSSIPRILLDIAEQERRQASEPPPPSPAGLS